MRTVKEITELPYSRIRIGFRRQKHELNYPAVYLYRQIRNVFAPFGNINHLRFFGREFNAFFRSAPIYTSHFLFELFNVFLYGFERFKSKNIVGVRYTLLPAVYYQVR